MLLKKRLLSLIFILIFASMCLVACKKPTVAILFNKDPITRETILNNSNNFEAGQRVYYIFISEKPIVTDMVRIQIFKYGDNGAGPTTLEYSNDYKIHYNEYHYFTDYIVLNQSGHYLMQVFATDQLYKPLARQDFYIR